MKQQYSSPMAEYSIVSTTDILTESLSNLGAYVGECGGIDWNDL